jgi:hypothetical protein
MLHAVHDSFLYRKTKLELNFHVHNGRFPPFISGYSHGATLFFKSAKPPQWGGTYQVGATLRLPYAEIEEPIYAFYNAKAKMSRVDYYNGKNYNHAAI